MGLISETAIFVCFSDIVSSFKDLLNNNDLLKDFVKDLFLKKGYNYDTFYSILSLVRNITIHGSFANTYSLKEEDFSQWKNHHIKKGISSLELKLNIVDKMHRLEVKIDIDQIQVGFKPSAIFDLDKMLMLIELCMDIIGAYGENEK